MKRDLLIQMGRFREDLGVKGDVGGGKDIDSFRRAVASDRRIVYLPDAVVEHLISSGSMTRAFHRRKQRAGIPIYQMTEEPEPP